MSPKIILVFCAQALLAQAVFSACAGGSRGYGNEYAAGCGCGTSGAGQAGGYGAGYGAGCSSAGVASTGGGLPISSTSPNGPVGIYVVSENAYEGTLNAGGNLPFLGAISIEGVLPTAGTGAVSYGCGDGAVAISSEGPSGTGILSGNSFAPSTSIISGYGVGNAGYGLGNAGYGLGNAGYGLGASNAGCGASRGSGASRGCGCGGRAY